MSNTPPHHPTFDVHLIDSVLEAIITFVFPNHDCVKVTQLESGKSFNNRIYFVQLESDPLSIHNQYVLKLSGHYFGARKVQNEVGALSLINKYCPQIPAPKIIAWSQNGQSIQTADGRSCEGPSAASTDHGWVLMTRLPGRVLEMSDLADPAGQSILRDLAMHMASWRSLIPSARTIGHMRFADTTEQDGIDTFNELSSKLPAFTLGGLILTHRYSVSPLRSSLEYFTYQFQDQYDHLTNAPELSSLSTKISSQVSDFIASLPKLSLFHDEPHNRMNQIRLESASPARQPDFVFSHMDFSPRNILVMPSHEGQNLEVSGILDFEFSAFLPYPEEFLNSIIHQSDDWPLDIYTKFLSHLKQFDIPTPELEPTSGPTNAQPHYLQYTTFKKLGLLERIVGNVAPWWITPQWHKERTESEIAIEIEKAADEVQKAIRELRSLEASSSTKSPDR